ncbi:MAG: hypothetical protein Q9165_000710 [Trypethelium subeluteriae]
MGLGEVNERPQGAALIHIPGDRSRASGTWSSDVAIERSLIIPETPELCQTESRLQVAKGPNSAEGKVSDRAASEGHDISELPNSPSLVNTAESHDLHAKDPNGSTASHTLSTAAVISSVPTTSEKTCRASDQRTQATTGTDVPRVPTEIISSKASAKSPSVTSLNADPTDLNTRDETNSGEAKLDTDFTYDDRARPPYVYESLVGMALCEAPEFKLTAAEIFAWISRHFPFYQIHSEGDSWRSTISVHLSQKPTFNKQSRPRGEGKKGCYWCLDESVRQYYSQLLSEARQKSQSRVGIDQSTLRDSREEQKPSATDADRRRHPFEISDNGYSHYKIVSNGPLGKAWQDLQPLKSVKINGVVCRLGDLIEYPCETWHRKQDPKEPQQVSVGQVLNIRWSQDARPLLHVLWYYRRTELRTIQCKNYRDWPSYCKWIKSTHMDIIFAQEVTGMMDPAALGPKAQDLVLDFSVGVGKGSMIRPKNHEAVSWLEDMLNLSPRSPLHAVLANENQSTPKSPRSESKRASRKPASPQMSTPESTTRRLKLKHRGDPHASSVLGRQDVSESDAAHTDPDPLAPVISTARRESAATPHENTPVIPQASGVAILRIAKKRGTRSLAGTITHDEDILNGKRALRSTSNQEVAGRTLNHIDSDGDSKAFAPTADCNTRPTRGSSTRLFQPRPRASGRYFKKRKTGRDCSFVLWPSNGQTKDFVKASASTPQPVVRDNTDSSRVNGKGIAPDAVNVNMIDEEASRYVSHESFEKLLGIGDEDDYEMILHEERLAFREKTMVLSSNQILQTTELTLP